MEAAGGRTRMRLMVVDFLATLFFTFCIGVVTALVLGACVVLMAGDAQGAAQAKPRAVPNDLVVAHYLASKYSGLVAIDRIYLTEPEEAKASPAPCKTKAGKRCKPS
jgi:hypothetical protein